LFEPQYIRVGGAASSYRAEPNRKCASKQEMCFSVEKW